VVREHVEICLQRTCQGDKRVVYPVFVKNQNDIENEREVMEVATINQKVIFATSPHEVYEALMDEVKHSKFTGGPARVSREVDGKFSAYGGYCSGTNIELIPDKKIVQNWRAGSWPEDHISKITLVFKEVPEGTELAFTHEGVPADDLEGISEGWHLNYWNPIRKMIENAEIG